MKSCGGSILRPCHNVVFSKILRNQIKYVYIRNLPGNQLIAYLRAPAMTLHSASHNTVTGRPKTLRKEETPRATYSNVPSIRTNQSMDRPAYEKPPLCTTREAGISPTNRDVYLALGSNLGDRRAMIEAACQSMTDRGIGVLRTSHLYETEPMYVENQDKFLNGVCQVSATESLPHSFGGQI